MQRSTSSRAGESSDGSDSDGDVRGVPQCPNPPVAVSAMAATPASSHRSVGLIHAPSIFARVSAYLQAAMDDPTDDERLRSRKRVLLVQSLATAVLPQVGVMMLIPRLRVNIWWIAGLVISDLVAATTLFMLFVKKMCPDWWVEILCYCYALTVMLVDFYSTSFLQTRFWAFFIVVLHVLLACRIRNEARVTRNVLVAATLWMAAMTTEEALSFGMRSAAYYGDDDRYRVPICDCKDPPCAHGPAAVYAGLFEVSVVCLSVCFTRHFAAQLAREKEGIEAAVNTAHYIAICLSVFDLDSADDALMKPSSRLPPGLTSAFVDIVQNLQAYKPYLPQSCMPRTFEGEDESSYASSRDELEEAASLSDAVPTPANLPLPLQLLLPGGSSDEAVVATEETPTPKGASASCQSAWRNEEGNSEDQIAAKQRLANEQTHLEVAVMAVAVTSEKSKDPNTPPHKKNKLGALQISIPHDTVGGEGAQVKLAGTVHTKMHSVRATLLQTNIHNSLQHYADMAVESYQSFFSSLLSDTLRSIHALKGIVDLFLGDRMFVSFNASRPCQGHAAAAVAAAKRYALLTVRSEAQMDAGIVTGRALCGNMGCSEMRRFSFLGNLPLMAAGVERCARALGITMLANAECRQDCALVHDMRLVFRKFVFVKSHPTRGKGGLRVVEECRLYEVLETKGRMEEDSLCWVTGASAGGADAGGGAADGKKDGKDKADGVTSPPPQVEDTWTEYNAAGELFLGGAKHALSSLSDSAPQVVRTALRHVLASPVTSREPYIQHI